MEKKSYLHTTCRKIVYMLYAQKVSVHTTYGQFGYILYVQVVYICHIYKDMSDDTE